MRCGLQPKKAQDTGELAEVGRAGKVPGGRETWELRPDGSGHGGHPC